MDAQKQALAAEQAASEELRQSVVKMRMQNAQLLTTVSAYAAKLKGGEGEEGEGEEEEGEQGEGEEEEGEEGDSDETRKGRRRVRRPTTTAARALAQCKHLEGVTKEALDARSRAETELDGLRSENASLSASNADLTSKVEAAARREASLTASWSEGLESLRTDAAQAKQAYEAKIERTTRELDGTSAKLRMAEASVADLTDANARLVEEKEREVRQISELAERHRTSSETAQERVMTMHRSMLDDLKLRDDRMREMHVKYSQEQIECQTRYTETVRALEIKTAEVGTLKRRVEALEGYDEECKRMRTRVHDMTAERARVDSEVTNLKRCVETTTTERDELRASNLKMENELAVLRAEKMMKDARQSMVPAAETEA